MKNLTFIVLIAFFLVSWQESGRLKKPLPEEFYGEWYNLSGNGEYKGKLITPDFVEWGYRPWYYTSISKDSTSYTFDVEDESGKQIKMTTRLLADGRLELDQYHAGGKAIYEKVDVPLIASKINAEDIPGEILKKWYSTNGESQEVFEVYKNKFYFNGEKYKYTSRLFFDQKDLNLQQYRFIVKKEDDYKMFYFKQWSNTYVQIGFGGKAGEFYKSSKSLPDRRIPNFDKIVETLEGQWYSTDGKNQEVLGVSMDVIGYKGQDFKYDYADESDGYLLRVKTNDEVKLFSIEKLEENYISLNQLTESGAMLLKRNKKDQDFIVIDSKKLPKSVFGNWYATDGDNKLAIEIGENSFLTKSMKYESILFAKTLTGYGIYQTDGTKLLSFQMLADGYMDVYHEGQQPMLLKKESSGADYVSIDGINFPKSLLGGWYGPETQMYLDQEFLLYNTQRSTYNSIQYHNGWYDVELAGDQPQNYSIEVNSKSGIVDSFTLHAYGKNPLVFDRKGPEDDHLSYDIEPSPVKEVTVVGRVTTFQAEDAGYNVQIMVNDPVYNTQIKYSGEVDKSGKFAIQVPMAYAQDVYVAYRNRFFVTTFLVPGSSIVMDINTEAQNIEFFGRYSRVAREVLEYTTALRKIQQNKWQEEKKKIEEVGPSEYYEHQYEKYKLNKDWLRSYCENKKLSKIFLEWAGLQTQFQYYDDLMRFSWLREHYTNGKQKKLTYGDAYYDFLKEIDVNKEYRICTSSLRNFLHEYEMVESRKYSKEVNFNTHCNQIADAGHQAYSNVMDSAGFTLLTKYKDADVASLDQSKKDTLKKYMGKVLGEGYARHLLKGRSFTQTIGNWRDSLQDGYFKELSLAHSFYRNLENGDLTVVKQQYQHLDSILVNADIRQYLSNAYQNLVDVSNSKLPKYVIANDAVQGSGDELLSKIIEKHKNKVIYLDIWATWCSPCRDAMEMVKPLKKTMEGKDVAFVYLCGRCSKGGWENFLKKHQVKGDHYFLDDKQYSQISSKFGITGIPHFVLINKKGEVEIPKAPGPWSLHDLQKTIEELL